MAILDQIISWSLNNPYMVFIVGLAISIALATDEETIPVTQNASLALIILSVSSVFLFYVTGGLTDVLIQIAAAIMGAAVTVFLLKPSL